MKRVTQCVLGVYLINCSDFLDVPIQSAIIAVVSGCWLRWTLLQITVPYSIYSSQHDFVTWLLKNLVSRIPNLAARVF